MDSKERKLLDAVRVKSIFEGKGGFPRKYKQLMVGDQGWWSLFKCELVVTFFGWIPGALGLALRYIFFPIIFKKVGKKVIFGRDMNIRSPHKITIGDNVIFDDDIFLDAKGATNEGTSQDRCPDLYRSFLPAHGAEGNTTSIHPFWRTDPTRWRSERIAG